MRIYAYSADTSSISMNAPLQTGFLVTVLLTTAAGVPGIAAAQGMPPEARKNIHLLFNQHEAVVRTVTMTRDGYVSLTESDDPKVAAVLKEHVRQMEERFKAGLMVRRHDPAFVEFAEHYDDISHVIEPTEKGLKATVTGRTPAAVKVAQNHANVVTDFATHGWEAHDRDHAAVLKTSVTTEKAAGNTPGAATKPARACCRNGGECPEDGSARRPSGTSPLDAVQTPKNP